MSRSFIQKSPPVECLSGLEAPARARSISHPAVETGGAADAIARWPHSQTRDSWEIIGLRTTLTFAILRQIRRIGATQRIATIATTGKVAARPIRI